MGAEPPAVPTGETTPDEEPMLATLVFPLTQLPPLVVFARVVVPFAHKVVEPVIIDGNGFTVTTAVTKQPPGSVYVRFAVPAEPPVIMPVPLATVAVPLPALVLHVPPLTLFVAVTVAALHTSSVPPIAAGTGFTEILATLVQPVVAV